MIPISNAVSRPSQAPAVRETERAREARPGLPSVSQGPLKPVQDEYVPEGEKKRESYGRYWLGKDKDGSPKIYFDDPEADDPEARGAAAPEAPEAAGAPKAENPERDEEPEAPGKAAPPDKGGKEEKCRGNTDAVDREIKRLKKKKEELEAKLDRETDEAKRETLERRLAQVENELRQKDNDAYRRQHSTFTDES